MSSDTSTSKGIDEAEFTGIFFQRFVMIWIQLSFDLFWFTIFFFKEINYIETSFFKILVWNICFQISCSIIRHPLYCNDFILSCYWSWPKIFENGDRQRRTKFYLTKQMQWLYQISNLLQFKLQEAFFAFAIEMQKERPYIEQEFPIKVRHFDSCTRLSRRLFINGTILKNYLNF